jgi:hypothetical protein
MGLFDSDRVENKAFAKGQIQASTVPNLKVSDTELAFLVQRAEVPKDFKGIITGQWVEGSEVLKGYLEPLISALVKRIESLEIDKLNPKMILIDEVPDIVKEGNSEILIRVYLDD